MMMTMISMGKETSEQPLILTQVGRKPAGTVAGVPTLESNAPWRMLTCHYCPKVGHLAKVHVCRSKLKKKNVHEIKATSAVNQYQTIAIKSSCDHMFNSWAQ